MEETATEEEMILNGMSSLPNESGLMSRDTSGSQLLIQKPKGETGEIT
jgi:hypothetical protein